MRKKMRISFVIMSTLTFIMIAGALACYNPPPPPDCYCAAPYQPPGPWNENATFMQTDCTGDGQCNGECEWSWNSSESVWQAFDCMCCTVGGEVVSGCEKCDCSDKNNGQGCLSENCEKCDNNGNCIVCEGDTTKTCSHGSKGTKCCEDGQAPCDGECCKENDEWCNFGTCECIYCYEFDTSVENTLPICPDCDNSQGGCYGDAYWITEQVDFYTGYMLSEGIGACGEYKTTKKVGYHVFCIERSDDLAELVAFLLEIYDTIDTFKDCVKCVTTPNQWDCFMCIKDLIVAAIIEIPPCFYVDSCFNCPTFNEECAPPIEIDYAVDWSKASLCYE